MEDPRVVGEIQPSEYARVVAAAAPSLQLNDLPPIYVLSAHLEEDELHEIEDRLADYGARLSYDPFEARIFIGKVQQKRRAEMELRTRGLVTEAVAVSPKVDPSLSTSSPRMIAGKKRRRSTSRSSSTVGSHGDSSIESEPEGGRQQPSLDTPKSSATQVGVPLFDSVDLGDAVWVVKLAWLEDAVRTGILHTLQPYTVYTGKIISKFTTTVRPRLPTLATAKSLQHSKVTSGTAKVSEILRRAQNDTGGTSVPRFNRAPPAYASTTHHRARPPTTTTVPALAHETTSEHDTSLTTTLPPLPPWATHPLAAYSCARATPLNPPNAHFINMLKTIRTARTLTNDAIGIRAYSTAIASLSAYPYLLTSPLEILHLPGCSAKIAALYTEYANSSSTTPHERTIQAAKDALADPYLIVLRTFYDIWGVGPHTARDFYNRGWRDLDDIIEHGWADLSRAQQLGVKYYDEFLLPIPRAEVEDIRDTIVTHARKVVRERGGDPDGLRTCIVGGYRRGKEESGDADVIVSHLDEKHTLDLIEEVVGSLSRAGWVTHNLSTHTSGSRRGQGVVPYRGDKASGGHGFDTLDKAMVVWQSPRFDESKVTDRDSAGKLRNPNVHRRVDIIIAPWSGVGCAVLGWSAGTTFERDLRRYAKVVKGWKFDSSGVRERRSGRVVDVEGGVGGECCGDVEEKERRVFEGLGLEWREPWERCTG